MLDIIELELNEDIVKQQTDEAICDCCRDFMNQYGPDDWLNKIYPDDRVMAGKFQDACKRFLPGDKYSVLEDSIEAARDDVLGYSAWRIEGTLREFKKFPPKNFWFRYPTHHLDNTGSLADIEAYGDTPPWQKNLKKKKSPEEKKNEKNESLEIAIAACSIDGDVTVKSLAEFMGKTDKTVRTHIKNHGGYEVKEGVIYEKSEGK